MLANLAYCDHILALNILQLANIKLDPSHIENRGPGKLLISAMNNFFKTFIILI